MKHLIGKQATLTQRVKCWPGTWGYDESRQQQCRASVKMFKSTMYVDYLGSRQGTQPLALRSRSLLSVLSNATPPA
jgi:hypothetical protein